MTLEVELSEYHTRVVDGVTPTDADLALAARLDTDFDAKIKIRWLRGDRVELTTTSWIGVVHLEGLRIVVRPKYAGDELGVVRMLEYTGGLDRARAFDAQRTIEFAGLDLLELVATLYAAEVERILLEGPLHDYRTVETDLPVLRGALRHREQATKRFGQLDRLECRFDEFDANIIENQLLLAGATVGARLLRSGPTRLRLRRLVATLEDFVEIRQTSADDYRRQITYGRRNERYRRAHDLALLLLDHVGVDDLWRASSTTSHVFLINMNSVFEAFVTRLISDAFVGEGWTVDGQRRIKSVISDRDSGRHYMSVVPDIVLSRPGAVVPIDCKYKLYGDRKRLSSGDVYQSFLYAFSLGERHGSAPASAIIHPAMHTRHRRTLAVHGAEGDEAATIGVIELDLVGAIEALVLPADRLELLASVRAALLPLARGEGTRSNDALDLRSAASYLLMIAERLSGGGGVLGQISELSDEALARLDPELATGLASRLESLAEDLKEARANEIYEVLHGQ